MNSAMRLAGVLGVGVAAALAGCAGQSRSADLRGSVPISQMPGARQPSTPWQPVGKAGAADAAAPTPIDVRRLPMFDADGAPVVWSRLIERLSAADVVLFGETHGHEVGLGAAAAMFEDLLAAAPGAALSMEFFGRDDQTHLDDYLSGVTDEGAFRRATGRSEGSYPEGHRAMVQAAKRAGRPVIGANAPRRYVRLARTEGFERLITLSERQRELFVIPRTLTEGRYRDEFLSMMGVMAGHGADQGGAEQSPEEQAAAEREAQEKAMSFFRSQNVWDATMAESIVRLVASGARPVVHVVGRFHSDFDGGLTQRVREALPSARIMTISMVDAALEGDALRDEDAGRADVVVYIGPGEAH